MRKGGPPAAIVDFDNQSLDQADVFIVRSNGSQIRIGTVFAGRRENLRVAGATISGDQQVNVVARIRSTSRTPRTGVFTLAPGDRVTVTLPSQENLLSVLPGREP
jgi:hypothetical protein